jgi:hypothetical protein
MRALPPSLSLRNRRNLAVRIARGSSCRKLANASANSSTKTDSRHVRERERERESSIDMYNNDVGKESAQKFMKQTGDLNDATLYFAS